MLSHIRKLIAGGETEVLDFKQSITDAAKIARTLVAFANNKGGTLLVGVRDNKTISGIRNDDELYMLELAGSFYCRPEIKVEVIEHEDIEGKVVLEAIIAPGDKKPYYAKDEEGKWWVYLRVEDKSLLASIIALEVLKRKQSSNGVISEYTDTDSHIINSLKEKSKLTLKDLQKKIPGKRINIINSLVNLIHYGIIKPVYIDKTELYTLNATF